MNAFAFCCMYPASHVIVTNSNYPRTTFCHFESGLKNKYEFANKNHERE